jgi:hypothetical protein
MIKSESMAILFHTLSTFMPLIIDDLKRARAAKLEKMSNQVFNPKTMKTVTVLVFVLSIACIHLIICPCHIDFLLNFFFEACFHSVLQPCIIRHGIKDAEPFPGLPTAERLPGCGEPKQAEFLFVYDFACGALASLKARLRRLVTQGKDIPRSVLSWAGNCKLVVDKFHFGGHVGVFQALMYGMMLVIELNRPE